jgi:hypothetical protein
MKIKDLLENVQDVELTPEQEKQIKEYLGIKETKRFVPRQTELYYYINSDLSHGSSNYNKNWPYDVVRLTIGNCFKTTKEAEFVAEQIKVYQELKNFADENNDPIDWNDQRSHKYSIAYSHEEAKRLYITCWATYQFMGCVWFSSMELAEQAIKTVGEDRIKKYLFGVK